MGRGKRRRSGKGGRGDGGSGPGPKRRKGGRRSPREERLARYGSQAGTGPGIGTVIAVFVIVFAAVLAAGVTTHWFRDLAPGADDDGDDDLVTVSSSDRSNDDDLKTEVTTLEAGDSSDDDDTTTPVKDTSDDDEGGSLPSGDGSSGDGLPEPGERIVLVEDFSNTGCPPCADADPEFDAVAKEYGKTRLAYVRYHVWWPDSTDPFYAQSQGSVEDRVDQYGVSAVPTIAVDGKTVDFTYSYGEEMKAAVDKALKVDAGLDIEATATLEHGDEVDFMVTLEDTDTSAALRLHVLLVETGIQFNAPNGEDVHNYVVKGFVSPSEGIDVDPDDYGFFSWEGGYSLPGNVNVNKAWLVAFVQGADGKVLNTAIAEF